MNDADERLRQFLAAKQRPVDHQFVASVTQRVILEQRMAAARANAWKRFAAEALASFVVMLVIAAIASTDWSQLFAGQQMIISPSTIALLLFGLWAVVQLKPAPLMAG